MKKYGRRYRRIQKENERRSEKNRKLREKIDQEVDGINISFLSMSHIVINNPIVYEKKEIKEEYIKRLNSYIRTGRWNNRKYENSELIAYEKIIRKSEEKNESNDISYYKYYIVMDVIHILGYEIKEKDYSKIEMMKEKYYSDFESDSVDKECVDKLFNSFKEKGKDRRKKISALLRRKALANEAGYLRLMLKNLTFREEAPVGVMVTATMSAGKSTFINALTGKYICLSQNMACTSKIHSIVNKAYEDGFSYEYDHDLVMTAGREELLNDNELNSSDKIIVGTSFDGLLQGHRIIINDSPGVNFSEDQEHKLITDKLIKGRNYHLLIYVMNATQLGTNDESDHLDYVKRVIGRTPVIFVINKIDAFNTEEESLEDAIQRQIGFLKKKGFKNPLICPVSSRAGYLSKQFKSGKLSRTELRELYNYIDKFEQMNLPQYYKAAFNKIKVKDSEQEELQLQKICGLAYVEKIIIKLTTGGKKNGTSLC